MQDKSLGESKTNKTSLCAVCQIAEPRYTCPGCGRRTCSLPCVQGHKETFSCNGKRDRTEFVKRSELSYKTLVSDYKLLEEIERIDDVARRSQPPAPRRQLPAYLKSLIYQAKCRQVTLHLLAPGMKKRRENTTRYDGKSKVLQWRVEWRFQSKDSGDIVQVTHTHRMPDNENIQLALDKHLSSILGDFKEPPSIGHVYMKQEGVPSNEACLYLVDTSQPLAEFLKDKYIIEYPVFHVILK